nr:reverse transcriptase domain-containing protein [Tanacetum cinerariifolium]
MSSASSAVTYTSVYTDFEPGRVYLGADEELSNGGSPLHTWPQKATDTTAPQDEDEHKPMFIQPHDPNFMSEPIYPEYIPLEDKNILPAKEQPLSPVVSPTTESPGYVAESDPEEDLEEYEDDETEDGPVDYPMDGGDDGDDDDDNSSRDDAGDEDEDEEEEHFASADSAAEVKKLLAMPTPSPSPLTSLSPPFVGERLARCTAPAALPSPPLPPPLHMPPRKRLCLSTLASRYEVGESFTARPTGGRGIDYGFVSTLDVEARRRVIREVGYDIRDTLVDPTETVPEIAPMTMGEVNTRVTDLAELYEHDTQELYALLEDAQDSRTRISQRVIVDSQQVDLLMEDKIAHPETIQIVEDEAYVAREAWAYSIRLSQAVHFELQTHQEQVHQAQMTETLRVMGDMRREMGDMQAELLALCEQPRRAGQPGGDARVPNHQDAPRDADRTEGVVSLTRWIKKIESVFQISGCAVEKQGEIKKLEIQLWNLKVKKNNVSMYTERFQELTLIYTKFVADETEKIDKYVSRLLDNIYGSVKASKPKTLDETIELANDLMDQKLRTYEERGAMRQNPQGSGCFECGATRHFKRDRPKLKNKDGEKVNAPGWVYADGNAKKIRNASRDLDLNIIMGNSYDVELADGKIVGVDIIMRGYTLNFLGHLFNIDLMPVELGSFDVIIGMDWLQRCHDVIVCDENLVQIPYGNETLTFRGNESNNGRESRLTVISCSKAQEYVAKRCQIFLAHISAKKKEDRTERK